MGSRRQRLRGSACPVIRNPEQTSTSSSSYERIVSAIVSISANQAVRSQVSNIAHLLGRGEWRTATLRRLLQFLGGLLALVELRGQRLGRAVAQRLLDEPAGLAARAAAESPGLDLRLALWADGDLDRLHEAPPTWIVSFTEPSGRACSTTLWPRLR